MSSCRSCAAPVQWVETENGKRMPIDRDLYTGDDPRGLFVLRVVYGPGIQRPRGRYIAVATTPGAFPGEPVYRSHFATCPNADEHRR